jgi:hypothetical protein
MTTHDPRWLRLCAGEHRLVAEHFKADATLLHQEFDALEYGLVHRHILAGSNMLSSSLGSVV